MGIHNEVYLERSDSGFLYDGFFYCFNCGVIRQPCEVNGINLLLLLLFSAVGLAVASTSAA